jgi:hypothetical protein
MALVRFLGSARGRWVRGIAGAALLALGEAGTPWWVPASGMALILVSALDVCLLAPLFGAPLRGAGLRGGGRVR